MADQPTRAPLRVSMVPGVMPGRWVRTWDRRHPDVVLELVRVEDGEQLDPLRQGRAEMAFVRDLDRPDDLHLIPLYAEVSVVVLPRDHPWGEAEELVLADLAEEHLLQPVDAVPGWSETAHEVRDGTRLDLPAMTTRQAVEVVASGTGVVVLPMSVARLHHRKDVVAVPVVDLPEHPVGLAWPRGAEADDPRIEDFIGIVRGRTERSSRGHGDSAATGGTGGTGGVRRTPGAPRGAARSRPSGHRGRRGRRR